MGTAYSPWKPQTICFFPCQDPNTWVPAIPWVNSQLSLCGEWKLRAWELQCWPSLGTWKKLAESGTRCRDTEQNTIPGKHNHRRPAKHYYFPFFAKWKKKKISESPSTGSRFDQLCHIFVFSQLTQTEAGFCPSFPDCVSAMRHLWLFPQGSSSPRLLTFSKQGDAYNKASPHSMDLSLEERHS